MTTTKPTPIAATPPTGPAFCLPDPPEDHESKVTSFIHLAGNGNAHHLAMHLGNLDTTLVGSERYVVTRATQSMAGSHYPDLLVAFDVNPAAYNARNGYIIAEQGKPPDFVLEIASPNTGSTDVDEKPAGYAAQGIGEYWTFDETGQHHGVRLSGYRLAGGVYVAIDIEELPDGSLQGYSPTLNLYLRWERGQLVFYDPATGRPIATFNSERERADREREIRLRTEARADTAEARANTAEARADTAEARADTAEARIRELEDKLRRRND